MAGPAGILASAPTASVGLTTISGSADTFMRSDAAPAIDVSISPTWTGIHQFSAAVSFSTVTGPFALGASRVPFVQNSITTTATTASGSPNITVTSANNLVVGMSVWTNTIVPYGTYITAIAGSVITLSANATATNVTPVSIQFGLDRWDTGSSIVSNTGGFNVLYLGDAAKGNTSWPNQYIFQDTGASTPLSPLVSISSKGRIGGFFATRASDFNNTGGFTAGLATYVWNDKASNPYSAWGLYIESHVTQSSTTLTFGVENSVENTTGSVPQTDPYLDNPVGGHFNERLDVGTGSHATSALQILGISTGKYYSGIIISSGALDTTANPKPDALSLAQNYAVNWYYSHSNTAWKLFSSATAFGGTFDLQSAGKIVVTSTGGPYTAYTNSGNSHVLNVGLTDGTNGIINSVGGGNIQLQISGSTYLTIGSNAVTTGSAQELVYGLDVLPSGSSANGTTATGPFIYLTTVAGTPTGVPGHGNAGRAACVYDTTNHKLWVYDQSASAWKGVALA